MRSTELYWAVTVTLPKEDLVQGYTKRFEFRGENAERDALDCDRRAREQGFETKIVKARVHAAARESKLA